jgi:hypothetical protein
VAARQKHRRQREMMDWADWITIAPAWLVAAIAIIAVVRREILERI